MEVDEAALPGVVGEEGTMADGDALCTAVLEFCWDNALGASGVEDGDDTDKVLLDAAGMVVYVPLTVPLISEQSTL